MNFEHVFKTYLEKQFFKSPLKTKLKKSMLYTLLAPASRFRVKLCFAVSEVLGQKANLILPWAVAIEMAHCASLIHDDLPTMDNASTRRKKACNHLVFGEDIALLSGTCLFIESFSLLNQAVFYKKKTQIINLFISKIGFQGMMSGQALDLNHSSLSQKNYLEMIRLKTGSLIEAACLGPVILWAKTKTQKEFLTKFSQHVGLAYQLADDLKDQDSRTTSQKMILKKLRLNREKSLLALQKLGSSGEKLKVFIPES